MQKEKLHLMDSHQGVQQVNCIVFITHSKSILNRITQFYINHTIIGKVKIDLTSLIRKISIINQICKEHSGMLAYGCLFASDFLLRMNNEMIAGTVTENIFIVIYRKYERNYRYCGHGSTL